MAYYSERHGIRAPINRTYRISPQAYTLLLKCCERFHSNLAWKYPEQCPDGHGCCGVDQALFDTDLGFEIPSLFRDEYGRVAAPMTHQNVFEDSNTEDEYDQYALLDYIEFHARHIKDVVIGNYHSYFGHYHLSFSATDTADSAFRQFQSAINEIFVKTGLLYTLTDDRIIERVIDATPLTPEIEQHINQIKEKGIRDLLMEAISLHRRPYPQSARDAVEKIWDALERLKTYYTAMDKKGSAAKIVNDMAHGAPEYRTLFDTEFATLTRIGNDFRIRHHEMTKTEISDPRYFDYFFNRCLSLISLAIQYLQ